MLKNYEGQKIELQTLKNMLKRENEIRLTKEIQMKYDQCALIDEKEYTKITDQLQMKVLKEFGFDQNEKELKRYRAALSMYPQEVNELKELVYYYKYNRSKDGELKVGDVVPLSSLTLRALDGIHSETLSTFCETSSVPVVLVAGSIT